MTDTERLDFITRAEVSLWPTTDDLGLCTGWVANDAAALVAMPGGTPRDAIDALERKVRIGR